MEAKCYNTIFKNHKYFFLNFVLPNKQVIHTYRIYMDESEINKEKSKLHTSIQNQQSHKSGFVNIIGKPNAGKSTLLNELVGERLAIITAKAQTTRHRIIGIVNAPDYQIVYSDTPGIIKDPKYKMQEAMMQFVKTSFKDADVLLVLADATEPDSQLDDYLKKINKQQIPVLFLLNKTDLISHNDILLQLNTWSQKIKATEYIPLSALKKHNVKLVEQKIIEYLPAAPPYYEKDALTDKPERFFVSEIIREKILLNYKQEVPYSIEVVIESFKEEAKLIRIRALILTNRASQKPILIGKGGSRLKKVGTQARKDMEAFLQKKVFLELYVKVRENWRDDEQFLKNMGY